MQETSTANLPVLSQQQENIIGDMIFFKGKSPIVRFGNHYEVTDSICGRSHRYGGEAFDGMIIVLDEQGKPYIWLFDEHVNRLLRAGVMMGFWKKREIQILKKWIHDFILEVHNKNGGYESGLNYISITFTEIMGGQGVSPVQQAGLRIAVECLVYRRDGYYGRDTNANDIVNVWYQTEYQRPANSGLMPPIKSGATFAYVNGRIVKEIAHTINPKNGGKCIDGLLGYHNIELQGLCFAEFSSSNMTFISEEGIFYAPKSYGNFLPGTTQSHLLSTINEMGGHIVVEDVPMNLEALKQRNIVACESTGSAGCITPVDCFVDFNGETLFEFPKSRYYCTAHAKQYYDDMLNRKQRPIYSILPEKLQEIVNAIVLD